MDKLRLFTRDRYYQYWPVVDAIDLKFTTGENGFNAASWSVVRPNRKMSFAWEDLSLNNQVYLYNDRGDLAWHGRLESVEAGMKGGAFTMNCAATGFWSAFYDLKTTGTIGSSTTPEALLTTIITTVSAFGIITNDATGLITTGLTGRSYQTPNAGTDYVKFGDAVLDICRWGTSTTGDRVVPQVWTGRKLVTARQTAVPLAAYKVSRLSLEALSLTRRLSSFYSRVQVRYKSSTDNTLQVLLQDDATAAGLLGLDYNDGTGTHPLYRSTMRDITGLSPTTSAAATSMANAILNITKRVQNEPQRITVSRDWVFVDQVSGQELPNWSVRAGNWLSVPDMFEGASDPADVVVGQSLGDENYQTLFYISATDYDCLTGQLTLTPGAGAPHTAGDDV